MVLAALAAMLLGGGAEAACAPPDKQPVADAVRAMFGALQTHDPEAVKANLTPDFYAYDGGRRYDGDALPKAVAAAQAAGKTFAWSVADPDVRLACEQAFIAYVNRGSVTDAKGATPAVWLESALLRFEDGRWRLAFLQSTRATPAP
jgi:hypothetical protein